MERARDNGLLIGKGGLYGNVIRMAPPMNIAKADVDEGIRLLDKSFAELRGIVRAELRRTLADVRSQEISHSDVSQRPPQKSPRVRRFATRFVAALFVFGALLGHTGNASAADQLSLESGHRRPGED